MNEINNNLGLGGQRITTKIYVIGRWIPITEWHEICTSNRSDCRHWNTPRRGLPNEFRSVWSVWRGREGGGYLSVNQACFKSRQIPGKDMFSLVSVSCFKQRNNILDWCANVNVESKQNWANIIWMNMENYLIST